MDTILKYINRILEELHLLAHSLYNRIVGLWGSANTPIIPNRVGVFSGASRNGLVHLICSQFFNTMPLVTC